MRSPPKYATSGRDGSSTKVGYTKFVGNLIQRFNTNMFDPVCQTNAQAGRSMSRFSPGIMAVIVALALTIAMPALAQIPAAGTQFGQIMGTVTDMNGDAAIGATVILVGSNPNDRRTVVTPENGFFQFDNVTPAVPYHLVIDENGFAEWTSPPITLQPGQIKQLGGIQLRLATQNTTVIVSANPVEIATEQVKVEETQRLFGILPNFYVTYEGANAAPLTTKMKFKLALRVSYDPVTIGAIAFVAGLKQAADSPDYQQGAKGYGERFGATAADGLSDIMIGGAILPSLLHQDPRYFYQGTGTVRSRLRHALLSPFIARGDNGKSQPNYSSMGGDLGSAALSNLYFPKQNRGVSLVFSQFALGTGERLGANVAQEFLLSRFTHHGRSGKQTSTQ
jgi:hypothetical protein